MSINTDVQTLGKQQYNKAKDAVAETTVSYDKIADQVKDSAGMIQKRAREYSDIAVDYAKENPLYIALGAAGIGFLAGAFLARRK
ncbi:MAG: hypothetical protein H7256_05345 [Bdellovibrio sp.]|nr:hypothetical protein [Bdellovibrio sp.]